MARSYRKSPFCGTCGGSDKADKAAANRVLRRVTREALRGYDAEVDVLPELRDVSDVWNFAKDGKIRFEDHPDDEFVARLLRK